MRDVQHSGTEAERSAANEPEVEGGLPEDEGVDFADIDKRLDEDPDEAVNRSDVPSDPEESVAAGSDDDTDDQR
jgi:hypothetical protein